MKKVSVHRLKKVYPLRNEKIEAVKEVSFDVEAGEVLGIIGPDGAGKTTLFRLLTTLLLPDGGGATVDGLDIVKDYKAIRRRVGYMPGRFSLYQDLSVAENLHFFATIFRTTVAANYDLIKDIYRQLEPFKERKAGKLSGGMKQKLALCCALVHRPVVLFLDEPTTGVDAVSRKEFWEMLQRLKHEGITILVSTAYMDEASGCDRVALMQEGNMLTIGKPEEITRSFEHSLLAVKSDQMFPLLQDLSRWHDVKEVYSFGEYHHAVMQEGYNETALSHYLQQKGHEHIAMQAVQPNIEDCFMQLMHH